MAQSNGGGAGDSAKMPSGIPYILVNEASERLSYYGLKAILTVVMTKFLLDSAGKPAGMTVDQAKFWDHIFQAAVYIFPFVGSVVADMWLGTIRTVLLFSGIYCVGLLCLAADPTRLGLYSGLFLVALGCGVMKPCVSANVGDQFDSRNQHLLSKVYNWFYFSINVGACLSMFFSEPVLDKYGPRMIFGVLLGFMVLATAAFYMGKDKFVRVPIGGSRFVREICSPEGIRVILRQGLIYLFVAVFWSLYLQTTSAWVLQAENMNLHWMGYHWKQSQVTAVNSALILIMIPLFNFWIYPAMDKLYKMTPLRKVTIGMFVTALSFLMSAWIERRIEGGFHPSIGWQVLAYVIITAGEILVSITTLEFAYTQAPPQMKSLVQSINLVSVAVGSLFTAAVNLVIQNPDGSRRYLFGADYYTFFFWVMLVTSVIFIVVATVYKEKTYIREAAA
jgi:proton-dependent oligopeptide transporter, POT family